MAWVGEMLVQGLANSISENGQEAVRAAEDMSADIGAVMNRLADDMQTSIPTDFAVDATVNANGRYGLPGSGMAAVYQTVNITTPKALSEKELARQFKLTTRKLALEL